MRSTAALRSALHPPARPTTAGRGCARRACACASAHAPARRQRPHRPPAIPCESSRACRGPAPP
eukprot:scaffold71645_cov66-Phaeocystis_antarctica.AAC.5